METDLESEPSVGLLPIDEQLELEADGATIISEGTPIREKEKKEDVKSLALLHRTSVEE